MMFPLGLGDRIIEAAPGPARRIAPRIAEEAWASLIGRRIFAGSAPGAGVPGGCQSPSGARCKEFQPAKL